MTPAKLLLIIVIVSGLFHGCASQHERPAHQYHKRYHVVKKGDTLYSIGWRYGVNTRQLAAWNSIAKPYTIYPGQRLRLNAGAKKASTGKRQARSRPSSRSAKKTAKRSSKKAAKRTAKKTAKSSRAASVKNWRWPVKGRLLSKFSSRNNGIDIVAKEGTAVVAAAAGKVVYAGSGLRGYGNLLIIKHNAVFFSAYAHNKRLLVNEGSLIKTGQKIAEVGSTGTHRSKLHFEIRKNGNPVDPLNYLPR